MKSPPYEGHQSDCQKYATRIGGRVVQGLASWGDLEAWKVLCVCLFIFAELYDFGVGGVDFSAKVKFGAVPAAG